MQPGQRAKAVANGMCPICGARPPLPGKSGCQKCMDRAKRNSKAYRLRCREKTKLAIAKWRKEHPEENRKIFKRHYSKLRDIVFNYYGKQCVCCGESVEFLTLDHKNNDGAEQRKKIGRPKAGGDAFYRWVIKNNFPNDLQPLCWNCNCAKSIYGECPHETTRKTRRKEDGEACLHLPRGSS